MLSLDDSDRGLLRYAARVVGLGGCDEVRFAHVRDDGHGRPSARELDALRAQIVAEVGKHFALDVPASVEVVQGVRLSEILALAKRNRHDLLLLGQRGEGGGRRSLARRLAMVAPCSVWLVPENAEEGFHELLVPVDFSPPSADALRVALSIVAAQGRWRCAALHVYFDPSTVRPHGHTGEVARREREALARFVEEVQHPGIDVLPLLEESARPAGSILRVAAERACDLIVMGTRGRSRAAALLLASVTAEAIAATTIPLLAVKHFGSSMTLVEALLDRRFWSKGQLKTN
jgi:nucleotide-binding universal stress UspA family protein